MSAPGRVSCAFPGIRLASANCETSAAGARRTGNGGRGCSSALAVSLKFPYLSAVRIPGSRKGACGFVLIVLCDRLANG